MSDPPVLAVVPPTQAQVEVATGRILAVGSFPGGSASPDTVVIVDLTEAQVDALRAAPPGVVYLEEDGSLRVDPPPPPPIEYGRAVAVDARVRTTDEVPHEVFRFPTTAKHVYRATLGMTAIDAVSGTTKDAEVRLVFKATATALSQVGATVVLSQVQEAAASTWAIQPSVSGAELVISVRGAAGRTVDWLLTGEIGTFAPEGLE